MTTLLKDEYFHFGTDTIYKELWARLKMSDNHSKTKPIGGLWTSKKDTNFLSEWLYFNERRDPYNFDLYVGTKKSSFVKFKEDTNFLNISTLSDYKNLKDSGFVITFDNPIILKSFYGDSIISELPNYDKIAEYYDLMYVDYYIHECFREFAVDTMYAINPNAIEYYKPIKVDYLNHIIESVGDKEYIKEPNKDYYNFLKYVKSLLDEIKADSYEEYIVKLKKLKNEIIKDIINNYNINNIIDNSIDKEKFVIVNVNNMLLEKKLTLKEIYNK